MSQGRLDRVGIEYTAQDKASATLKKIAQVLESLERRTTKVNALFSTLGETGNSKLGQVLERMERMTNAMRTINRLGRQNFDQDKQELRLEYERDRLAEKLSRERAKTLALEERISHQKVNQVHSEERIGRLGRLGALAQRIQYASPMTLGFNNLANTIRGIPENNPEIRAALEWNQAQTGFRLMGLSDASNQHAFSAATTVADRLKGVTYSQALENIKDLHNATKNLDEAVQLAPMFSKMVAAMQAGGTPASHKQIMDTAKAAEMMMTGNSPAELQRSFAENLDIFTKVRNASLGRITGTDFLNWAKTAGLSRLKLDRDAKFTMGAMMQEMGGSRSGTAFMSAFQNLVFGRASQKSSQALMQAGLLNPQYLVWNKSHRDIRGFKAGGLKDSSLFMRDPFAWMQKDLIAPILNTDIKKYGKDEGTTKAIMTLSEMMGNRSGLNLFGTGMLQFTNWMRDKRLGENAMGIDQSYSTAMKSSTGSMVAFNAALTNLNTEVGTRFLPNFTALLNHLTDWLRGIDSFASKHPTLFNMAVGGGVAAAGVAAVAPTALGILGSLSSLRMAQSLGAMQMPAHIPPVAVESTLMGGEEAVEGLAGAAAPGFLARLSGRLSGAWEQNGITRRLFDRAAGPITRVGERLGGRFGSVFARIGASGMGDSLAAMAPALLENAALIGGFFALGYGLGTIFYNAFIKGSPFEDWLTTQIANTQNLMSGSGGESDQRMRMVAKYGMTPEAVEKELRAYAAFNQARRKRGLPNEGLAQYEATHGNHIQVHGNVIVNVNGAGDPKKVANQVVSKFGKKVTRAAKGSGQFPTPTHGARMLWAGYNY